MFSHFCTIIFRSHNFDFDLYINFVLWKFRGINTIIKSMRLRSFSTFNTKCNSFFLIMTCRAHVELFQTISYLMIISGYFNGFQLFSFSAQLIGVYWNIIYWVPFNVSRYILFAYFYITYLDRIMCPSMGIYLTCDHLTSIITMLLCLTAVHNLI